MTGVLLMADSFSLVVVEGCNKAHKRYAKLMLRRINWNKSAHIEGDDEEEEEGGTGRVGCHMVWKGVITEPAFSAWKVHKNASVQQAKDILAEHGVSHYWDIAQNFNPDDAPAMELQ